MQIYTNNKNLNRNLIKIYFVKISHRLTNKNHTLLISCNIKMKINLPYYTLGEFNLNSKHTEKFNFKAISLINNLLINNFTVCTILAVYKI